MIPQEILRVSRSGSRLCERRMKKNGLYLQGFFALCVADNCCHSGKCTWSVGLDYQLLPVVLVMEGVQ